MCWRCFLALSRGLHIIKLSKSVESSLSSLSMCLAPHCQLQGPVKRGGARYRVCPAGSRTPIRRAALRVARAPPGSPRPSVRAPFISECSPRRPRFFDVVSFVSCARPPNVPWLQMIFGRPPRVVVARASRSEFGYLTGLVPDAVQSPPAFVDQDRAGRQCARAARTPPRCAYNIMVL